jgi:hypothetical protein
MTRSKNPVGRARVRRACALALVRIWTWVLLIGSAGLMLSACGGGGGGGTSPPQPPAPVVNAPPVANAGADQLVLTSAPVNISGSGTDSDGSIASYSWAQTGGGAVTLTGANSANLSFTAPGAAATLAFDLTVTDNLGLARTDSVTINVNAPPVATAGTDLTVAAGANVALGGSGTDANGSIASYAWTQTGGAAVTLAGAASAAASFTAPTSAAVLEFRLTVTDNQGASHSDTVAVNVRAIAAPAIAHHPNDVRAFEHATALFFVHATGEDLSYEWRYTSGVVAKAASPEPFYIRGTGNGLSMVSNGECFRVVVSNSVGSVTSEPACLEVHPVDGDIDVTDENNGDDYSLATAYGNAVLNIIQESAAVITGGVGPLNRTVVPRIVGPGKRCQGGGEFAGAAFDGQAVSQLTNLPLGRHTVSLVWRDCANGDPDEPSEEVGAVMIAYDFPTVFGVGSFTLYFSGYGDDWRVLNGILEVTLARGTSPGGWPTDEIVMTLQRDFSAADLKCECNFESEITLTRKMNMAETVITDAELDFNPGFDVWDEDGFVGNMHKNATSSNDIDLHFDPDVGDTGVPASTSEGSFDIGLGTSYGSGSYLLGTIIAGPGGNSGAGWVFHVDPPDEEDGGN